MYSRAIKEGNIMSLPNINGLQNYSVRELTDHLRNVEGAIKKVQESAKASTRKEIDTLLAERGLTFDDILGSKSGGKKESVAKYQSPEGQTWSGRGRKPSWAQDWVDSGKSLDDLKV